jgi:DNA-binding transcriptional LysR family regulator
MGIAMAFSYNVAAAIKDGTLTTLLDSFQPPLVPVSLVYSTGRFMPIKLRAFLDFASPRLKEGLATVMACCDGAKRRMAGPKR